MNEKRKGKEIKMLTALIQYIIEIIVTSIDLIRRKLYVRILRGRQFRSDSYLVEAAQRTKEGHCEGGREDIVREGGRTL